MLNRNVVNSEVQVLESGRNLVESFYIFSYDLAYNTLKKPQRKETVGGLGSHFTGNIALDIP